MFDVASRVQMSDVKRVMLLRRLLSKDSAENREVILSGPQTIISTDLIIVAETIPYLKFSYSVSISFQNVTFSTACAAMFLVEKIVLSEKAS